MRIFQINQDTPLHLIICGQLKSKDNFLHIRRNFSDNVLIFIQEGILFINSNNHEYKVCQNQFIFLKAGEEHFGFKKSSGKLSYFWLHFQNPAEQYDEITQTNQKYIFPEYGTINNTPRLNMLFRQMMDYSLDQSFYTKKILDYSLSIFMMEFTQNYLNSLNVNSSKQNPLIHDICNWIKFNYQKDFSIEDLSEEFKLQSSYMSKLFKQNMGKSIVQYITEIRILAAKDMLNSFSIKETAYSCGFIDEKYFMKVFKKNEGITPTQYKKAFSLKNINQ